MIDEVREVLRRHEALVVHFNGPASRHDIGYPEDLRDAIAHPQWAMCYSTVVKSDLGPYQISDPSVAATFGSVGLVIDLQESSTLIRVHNSDGGSNGRDHLNSLGDEPTAANCEASIVSRRGYNEWLIANPRVVGIFTFINPHVCRKGALEAPYRLSSISNDFPDHRIFTIHESQFHELDRTTDNFLPRTYSEIISP